MADTFSKEKRSWVMSRVRGSDTKPEKAVRSFLHARGFRYRLHVRTLPGKPDIVLPRYSTVILVHGCFWHGHKGCARATQPKTHSAFWTKKLSRNVERDKAVCRTLRKMGWKVLVLWECEVRKTAKLERCARELSSIGSR